MTVFTYRTNITKASYGFETTQSYRHELLDRHGIANQLLNLSPYGSMFRGDSNWRKQLSWIRFPQENLIFVPHRYSDLPEVGEGVPEEHVLREYPGAVCIGRSNDHSMYLSGERYLDLMFQEGNVRRVSARDMDKKFLYIDYYTTGKFCRYTPDDKCMTFFDSSGAEVLKCFQEDKEWRMVRNGETLTIYDMLFWYLDRHAKPGDILIFDMPNMMNEKVHRYAEQKKLRLHRFLHYNLKNPIKDGRFTDDLPHEFFCCSRDMAAWINENSEFHAAFMPSVGMDGASTPPPGLSGNRFYLTGNFGKVKRLPMAVEAMKQVPEAELDIYGGSTEEITDFRKEHEIPPNVHFKGTVSPSEAIPRREYAGYVSCSESEVYANAMIEACAAGSIPVVSDIEFGHCEYMREMGLDTAFTDAQSLASSLRRVCGMDMQTRRRYSERVLEWVRRFSVETCDRIVLEDLGLWRG